MPKKSRYKFRRMYTVLVVFCMIAIFLFAERMGIQHSADQFINPYIQDNTISTSEVLKTLEKTSLVLVDTRDKNSVIAATEFKQILEDMRVGYRIIDLKTDLIPELSEYRTMVILLPDLSKVGEEVKRISDWVREGGNVLFGLTLAQEMFLSTIKRHMGIISDGYTYNMVENIYPEKDFMLGGGRSYAIEEPYESAWSVTLSDDCEIHAYTDDEKKTPLIWSRDYGKGRFVVDNFGIYTKNVRGFYAASYSLLEDQCIYPVINGQVYYIDDFPSPTPGGNGEFVQRDYDMNIADFYINIWWPDMLKVAKEYGIKYSGGVIENYEDDTSENIVRQKEIDQFIYFGNMLLANGGEISYHGYNHQPLSPKSVDYVDVYAYNTWESNKAMQNSITELMDFTESMFPNVHKSIYIPPSNVLSDEGREMLGRQGDRIRSIASTYFSADFSYTQEFEVADDGIIEQPRIVSGGIMDSFMKMAAMSELNMHYISSHFLHPDDTLDIDRGAEKGWAMILKGYRGYVDWVHQSAPKLRHLTASQFGAAVERYGILKITKSEDKNSLKLHLDNFHEEAYMFVRFNRQAPERVDGGELQRLTGNLYLLRASKEEVRIQLQ